MVDKVLGYFRSSHASIATTDKSEVNYFVVFVRAQAFYVVLILLVYVGLIGAKCDE